MQLKRKALALVFALVAMVASASAHASIPRVELLETTVQIDLLHAPAIDLAHETTAQEHVQSLSFFSGSSFEGLAQIEVPAPSIAAELESELTRKLAAGQAATRAELRVFEEAAKEKLASGVFANGAENNFKLFSNLSGKRRRGTVIQALPFVEPVTGLVYARERWYDPSTGTFLSPDPMGYEDSSNLYLGFGGDPVNNRDPLGMQVAEPMPVRPWRSPVVQPPQPGQRGPVIGPSPAPLISLDAPPEDFHNVIAQWEAAKARRPKGAGTRVFHGLTADELTPEEQQKFLTHRNRLRNDAAYREWWNSPPPQIGSIVPGSSPEMPIESLPALGGAGGGDDGGDDGIYWNNGWRTANGKFASPVGAGQSGREAEESVWDAVAQKPGWRVARGRVYVRDPDGVVRVYDGVAISPRGRAIGLEVKSGSARRTASQREFDQWLNSGPANTAVGVGQNRDLRVRRAIEIRKTTQ